MVLFDSVQIFEDCCIYDTNGVARHYDEENLHKPYFTQQYSGTGLPWLRSNPLETFFNLVPRKGHELNEMELPLGIEDTGGAFISDNYNFIIVKYTTGSSQCYIMGWIDSMEPVATKGPDQNTRIRWHVDWWLTSQAFNYLKTKDANYSSKGVVTFGAGRVKRGPWSMARPDPSEPRRWVFGDALTLSTTWQGGGPKFVLLIYQKTVVINQQSITSLEYLDWQIGETITSGGNTYVTMTINELYNGLLEEKLGIDPDSIVGCWVAPFDMAGASTALLTHGSYAAHIVGLTTATYVNNITTVVPNDYDMFIVTDQNGQKVGEIGWGCNFDRITITTDAGTEGCRIRFVFSDTSKADWLGEGRVIEVPAIPVPVTSNAMASYTYSGQREYDRTTARINQQKQLVSSVTGLGTSAIGGAVAGTVAAPGIGTAVGAMAGVTAGSVGALVNNYTTGIFNDKEQAAIDRQKSQQTGNIVMGGGGPNWLRSDWHLVRLTRDPESTAELQAEQSQLGYVTDAYTTNVGLLIAAGGPLKIEGLQINGGINKEGKRYISSLFSRGVHIDLIT